MAVKSLSSFSLFITFLILVGVPTTETWSRPTSYNSSRRLNMAALKEAQYGCSQVGSIWLLSRRFNMAALK